MTLESEPEATTFATCEVLCIPLWKVVRCPIFDRGYSTYIWVVSDGHYPRLRRPVFQIFEASLVGSS